MTTNEAAQLECQDCGEVVRVLSQAERARVAARPYDFIVYCAGCRRQPAETAMEAAG